MRKRKGNAVTFFRAKKNSMLYVPLVMVVSGEDRERHRQDQLTLAFTHMCERERGTDRQTANVAPVKRQSARFQAYTQS
jgi:hypothetical protein